MNRDDDRIITEAAGWHVASARDDMDWEGFANWLDADPSHRAAYDEVALADALLDENREVLRVPAVPEEAMPGRRRWMAWAGAAIAASLVAALAVPQFLNPDQQIYETGTSTRTIALADGSSILLAPHSRLAIAGGSNIALAGGAWFDIRHDPSRQLAISAGDVTIGDIGTRFDVQATGAQVRVEVAQGEVQVSSPALSQPLRLAQGRSLLFDGRQGTAVMSSIAQGDIGEWRKGRLSYDGAPLSLVAADLSRYAAVRVTVPDTLQGRPFSGTLIIGDGKTALRDLSQVMDLELGRDAGGYRLSERR